MIKMKETWRILNGVTMKSKENKTENNIKLKMNKKRNRNRKTIAIKMKSSKNNQEMLTNNSKINLINKVNSNKAKKI